MPYASFVLPMIVGFGLILGWLFARWVEKCYDRAQATSEEILDELEMAYSPRRSMELRVRPDRVATYLECVRDQIDAGFNDRNARSLAGRIRAHESSTVRSALYPVKVNGVRTDVDFQWSRDADDRVRLLVLAVPKVIRALKHQVKGQRSLHRSLAPSPASAADPTVT